MTDQASQLRKMVRKTNNVRALAISSGKGGVGKTSISVNLGIALAGMNKKVLIIDADMGLANIDVILGIRPLYNIQHVVEGTKTLKDIVVDGPGGIKIIPSSSGIQALTGLDQSKRDMLIKGFAGFENVVDFLLIDTAAGISADVTEFIAAAGELIVVTTPEPTAITDAYALMKVVSKNAPDVKIYLFVNQVSDVHEAQEIEKILNLVAERFLGKKIFSIGFMQKDPAVTDAIKKQEPFVLMNTRCPASVNIKQLATRLCSGNAQENNTSLVEFAEKLTGMGKQ